MCTRCSIRRIPLNEKVKMSLRKRESEGDCRDLRLIKIVATGIYTGFIGRRDFA